MKSLKERFEAKVSPEPTSGCWLWTSSITGTGYGTISLGGRADGREQAHRVAWELYRGSIPPGLCVLHRCDNRLCVNPDHLFLGTKADNTHDMLAKGREARGARHGSRTKPEEFREGCRRGGMKGEAHHQARLTEDLVAQIRRRVASGATSEAVAAEFGVAGSTIRRIAARKLWRHVP